MTRRELKTLEFITQEVCKVIANDLWSEFVNFPETVYQMIAAILQVEEKWQFPNAFVGVDHGHIPIPVDIGRKFNVDKTLRRRPGRLLKVLCTFNLGPVSAGMKCSHGENEIRNGYYHFKKLYSIVMVGMAGAHDIFYGLLLRYWIVSMQVLYFHTVILCIFDNTIQW